MTARFDAPTLAGAVIALLGAAWYALLASGAVWAPETSYFGESLYDAYWASVRDGRLDVPPRLAYFEGHYAQDGRAYLYHGAAPLLTRGLFGWATGYGDGTLAKLTVFFGAALGTVLYHAAIQSFFLRMETVPRRWTVIGAGLIGVGLWFGGPGVLLATNTSFYHEPIAIAFLMGGLFVFVLSRVLASGLSPLLAVVPLAAAAALTLHARPNLAVGLYLGVLILLARNGLTDRFRAVPTGAAALVLLAASGLGYMTLNSQKFGSPDAAHGEFSAEAPVVYGEVFWGMEHPKSARAEAFAEHGRFNPARIAPNAVLYLLAMPTGQQAPTIGDALVERFHAVTGPRLGYIRVEHPWVGIAFLWPAWLLLAVFAARGEPKALAREMLLGAGLLTAALLTLSYGTVALRYRIDLWPLIAFAAMLGLPNFVRAVRPGEGRAGASPLLVLVAVGGLALGGAAVSMKTARAYALSFGIAPELSKDTCLQAYRTKGFDEPSAEAFCSL